MLRHVPEFCILDFFQMVTEFNPPIKLLIGVRKFTFVIGFVTNFIQLLEFFEELITFVSTLILSVLNLSVINNPKDSQCRNIL
jgi:hypothetical protein